MDRTRQYFTFVYGVLDGAHGRFRYVRAGHPAPVVLPRNGPPVPLHGGGLPIGMIEQATFDDETTVLQRGSAVLLHGWCHRGARRCGAEFGYARLLAELERLRDRPLRPGLDEVADAVRDWSGGCLRDDVSLLAVERSA